MKCAGGAAPEIIEDGKTGFIVDSIAEMAAAVGKIDTLRREDCRDHAIATFSHEKMVDAYEDAFTKILRKHRKAQTPTERGKDIAKKLKQSLPKKNQEAFPPKSSNLQKKSEQIGMEFKELVKEIARPKKVEKQPETPTD